MQEVEELALQIGLAGRHSDGWQQRASGAQWLAHPERCHEGSTVVLVVLNCKAKELEIGKEAHSLTVLLEVAIDRLCLTSAVLNRPVAKAAQCSTFTACTLLRPTCDVVVSIILHPVSRWVLAPGLNGAVALLVGMIACRRGCQMTVQSMHKPARLSQC